MQMAEQDPPSQLASKAEAVVLSAQKQEVRQGCMAKIHGPELHLPQARTGCTSTVCPDMRSVRVTVVWNE